MTYGCTKERDVVALVLGAKLPFCLRCEEQKGMYQLLGEPYIHGVMHGEAFNVKEVRNLRFY